MRSYPFVRQIIFIYCFLSLAACAPAQEPTISATTPTVEAATSVPTVAQPNEKPVVVAFVQNGDIQLWNSNTNQSHTLIRAGDVTTVSMSDDGEVIAFLRRSLVGWPDDPDWLEQHSLWAVDRNGKNPRELVSAEDLRQQFKAGERDSTAIAQISWIPNTHRLLYSGIKYIVQGEGTSHASPEGLYLVDTETLSSMVLVEAGNAVRVVPSPNGQQLALMSTMTLSFINADGTNSRQNILTYPAVGMPGSLLPNGVWTQDSRAFVFTNSIASESPHILNYTILRVPVDGSPIQSLATINESHSDSVSFSPDGKYAGFLQRDDFLITALTPEAGPLALPYYGKEAFFANLHWSPDGAAYVIKDQDLLQLCADATQAAQVCGEPIHLGSGDQIITSIHWVDSTHFLYAAIEPASLSMGSLDGTLIPIVTWTEGESESWSSNALR